MTQDQVNTVQVGINLYRDLLNKQRSDAIDRNDRPVVDDCDKVLDDIVNIGLLLKNCSLYECK